MFATQGEKQHTLRGRAWRLIALTAVAGIVTLPTTARAQVPGGEQSTSVGVTDDDNLIDIGTPPATPTTPTGTPTGTSTGTDDDGNLIDIGTPPATPTTPTGTSTGTDDDGNLIDIGTPPATPTTPTGTSTGTSTGTDDDGNLVDIGTPPLMVAIMLSAAQTDEAPAQTDPPTPTPTPLQLSVAPLCSNDVPMLSYSATPVAYTPTGPATLSIFDVNGAFVKDVQVTALSGSIVFPGATMSQGFATDWPGWRLEPGGLWVEDAGDAILRQGVKVTATVPVGPGVPPAIGSANASYVPAGAECASPVNVLASPSAPTPPPATVIAATSTTSTTQQVARDSAGTSTGGITGELPATGGAGVSTALAAGVSLGAGMLLIAAARRRRRVDVSAS